ncbi:MAG TPA: hypothetical protein VFN74_12150 [Chloroflexota bacterium]|nr:hypothetical protein [Chloroflexota bacterium]
MTDKPLQPPALDAAAEEQLRRPAALRGTREFVSPAEAAGAQ